MEEREKVTQSPSMPDGAYWIMDVAGKLEILQQMYNGPEVDSLNGCYAYQDIVHTTLDKILSESQNIYEALEDILSQFGFDEMPRGAGKITPKGGQQKPIEQTA